MTRPELNRALRGAVEAAQAAGTLMRQNLRTAKRINATTQHDIKLELDVRCQTLIARRLLRAFPEASFLGEEGEIGAPEAPTRWVVDPIDGTVNFTYGVPHAGVSIALQAKVKRQKSKGKAGASPADLPYETLVGVVYDPFTAELWTAIRGGRARLNGRPIHVSRRRRLGESIIALGFAKDAHTLGQMLPVFNRLVHRVRKIRIMGAAALSMAYVATGRFEAYLEYGLRLWDIAAGGLIVECAGGEFWHRPLPGEHSYEIIANNRRVRGQLGLAD
jgi:myo-inositol-1(or 4)-monophosphatase